MDPGGSGHSARGQNQTYLDREYVVGSNPCGGRARVVIIGERRKASAGHVTSRPVEMDIRDVGGGVRLGAEVVGWRAPRIGTSK
jgi:hypothetical protein